MQEHSWVLLEGVSFSAVGGWSGRVEGLPDRGRGRMRADSTV